MAGKSAKSKSNPWDVQFVNLDLTTDQKKKLLAWDVKYEATIDCLSGLVAEGHKLSISGDTANDAIIAALTLRYAGQTGQAVCLVARGPSLLDAQRSLAYKIVVLLDGKLDDLAEKSAKRDAWG